MAWFLGHVTSPTRAYLSCLTNGLQPSTVALRVDLRKSRRDNRLPDRGCRAYAGDNVMHVVVHHLSPHHRWDMTTLSPILLVLLLSPCSLTGSVWSVRGVATCSRLSRLPPSAPSTQCLSLHCPFIFFLWLVSSSRYVRLATCVWLEYCRDWFSELSFSRINEFTKCYTFTPCVGYFTSLGIDIA